jgi:hypothetical protein
MSEGGAATQSGRPASTLAEAVWIGYADRGSLEVRGMSDRNTAKFRATAGVLQGFGKTPQEALAALIQHAPNTAVPIVIWPYNRGDAFFTAEQQARLQELKQRQELLTADEGAELEDLVAAAFDATVARTQAPPVGTAV